MFKPEKSLSDLFSSSDEEFYQSMLNSPILKIKDREDAKDEILRYMIKQINLETGRVSDEDAFDNWEQYKKQHNIE